MRLPHMFQIQKPIQQPQEPTHFKLGINPKETLLNNLKLYYNRSSEIQHRLH